MSLTQSQLDHVNHRLLVSWPQPRHCPICNGCGFWTIGALLSAPALLSARVGADEGYIYLPCLCERCGYTVLFNAITLGLIDQKTGKLIG